MMLIGPFVPFNQPASNQIWNASRPCHEGNVQYQVPTHSDSEMSYYHLTLELQQLQINSGYAADFFGKCLKVDQTCAEDREHAADAAGGKINSVQILCSLSSVSNDESQDRDKVNAKADAR